MIWPIGTDCCVKRTRGVSKGLLRASLVAWCATRNYQVLMPGWVCLSGLRCGSRAGARPAAVARAAVLRPGSGTMLGFLVFILIGLSQHPARADNPSLWRTPVGIDESLPSCIAVAGPDGLTYGQRAALRRSALIKIGADEAVVARGEKLILRGDVSFARADQSLRADDIAYDKPAGLVDAEGGVVYEDGDMRVTARQAHLDFSREQTIFTDTGFSVRAPYSRGSAARILAGERIRLDDVHRYTTCPPGHTTWRLQAERLVLDDTTGRGEGRNVTVRFLEVPVLYTPYINFPIDDRRQTGLLTPRFSHSNSRGTEILAPVYWNIAAERDATLQPRYMSGRGLQLGAEYRYLNRNNRGQINLEYLGGDDRYTGSGDSNRWAFHYQHEGLIGGDWLLDTGIRRVSDSRYFEDFGSGPALAGRRHLESRVALGHDADNWSLHTVLQDYQTVDTGIPVADHPYGRMPHIQFDARTDPSAGNFVAAIHAQYTDFDKDDAVTGRRVDIYPGVTYHYAGAGYYIRPRLGVRYTSYSLDNQGNGPSDVRRSMPILSIDGGLFYDRLIELSGKSMLQTLEPRVYYLNVPERRQARIPIFDTGRFDLNSSTLFSENRFNGIDRIGDTQQISVGISSRFIEPSGGTEKLAMTLGQIYYFDDRDVTLPNESPDTDDSSPVLGEIRYRPDDRLLAGALLHWDPETGKTGRSVYRMKYQPADKQIINLAYRHRMGYLRQADFSFLWPLDRANRWHGIGRWNYSLKHNQTLDAFVGVEYEGCCWKTRLVARRWVNGVEDSFDTNVFFEVELKGLGSIGDDISDFLQTGIPGYNHYR